MEGSWGERARDFAAISIGIPLRSSVIVTALDLACEMIQPGHRGDMRAT